MTTQTLESQTAKPATTQLYVVYMFSSGLSFGHFQARHVASRRPTRELTYCPVEAHGFHYAYGPEEGVERFSQLTDMSGFYFVDAIVIPTARLSWYVKSTKAYGDVGELLRNSQEATHHAHGRNGRFYAFDPGKDKVLSTRSAFRS